MRKDIFKRKFMRLQILVTHSCNARCDHCDKAVGLAHFPDMRMTAETVREYMDQARREGLKITRLTLSGGEPILNPELQQIIEEVKVLPHLKKVRVLTNCLQKSEPQRAKIVLPDKRYGWCEAPIDDITDPFSGKNIKGVRVRNRTHNPYWISPDDLGMKATYEKCGSRHHCGRGLANGGWAICGQAPILSRVLDIPSQTDQGDIWSHVNTDIPEMCKHCMHGLNRREQKLVYKMHRKGKIPDVTPTFQKAFDVGPYLVDITRPDPDPDLVIPTVKREEPELEAVS